MNGSRSKWVGLLLGLTLTLTASPLWAQDAQDSDVSEEAEKTEDGDQKERKTLADRVKSVERKVFLKKKRVEIFPHLALDLNDPFYQHIIIGGSLAYHLADSFALEVRGGGTVASIQQNAIRFVRKETGSLLEGAPEFRFHGDLDMVWAPLYGKISLFGESILHFDTFITGGGGVFVTSSKTRAIEGGPLEENFAANPSLNIGLGQRYFINEWLTARIELRNYVFVTTGNSESDLQNLMVLGFSISGFLPTSFSYEFQ